MGLRPARRAGPGLIASQYARGAARERQLRERYEAKGYYVVRGAGSKGGDLIAGRSGSPTLLIEVKATAAGPWSGFGPADRTALIQAAERAGWEPLLVWWPMNRKHPRFVPKEGWPNTKEA